LVQKTQGILGVNEAPSTTTISIDEDYVGNLYQLHLLISNALCKHFISKIEKITIEVWP
jgi:hypothetical protein